MNLIYRPQFMADVADGADYLTEKAGEEVADAWREALKLAILHLQRMPELGRVRHDLPLPAIRDWLHWRPNLVCAVGIGLLLFLSIVIGISGREKLEFLYFQF